MAVIYLLDAHDVSIAGTGLYVDDATTTPPLGTVGTNLSSLSITVLSH